MKSADRTGSFFTRLTHHVWLLALLWTGCVAGSLLWNLHEQDVQTLAMARHSARLTFENDVLYRLWAARQGGVYVRASAQTPPNPYLKVPDRDVTTTSGLSLTLINPAYMVRLVHESADQDGGSRGHITSLRPLRPENGPDAWEEAALQSFQTGRLEVSSVERMSGGECLRFMRPLVAETACLKCHAAQGYREGDIRGGLSVSVPMASALDTGSSMAGKLVFAHTLLWTIGLAGIGLSKRTLGRQVLARERSDAALRESEERFRSLVQQAVDGIFVADAQGRYAEVNAAGCQMLGYTREELLRLSIADAVAAEDVSRIGPEVAKFSGGKVVRSEWRFRRKDGSFFPGEVVGRQTADGRLVAILRDITERKQAEEALRGMNAELERRVAGQTAELRQVNETLEQRVAERAGEIQKANEELQASRRAALNLMDDAIAARQQVEQASDELARYAEELRVSNEELTRFNRAMVDRELRMIELKKQVNDLCQKAGLPPEYTMEFGSK